MGIVTKKGDEGKTTLLTGETVSKASARCEAYGTVDELGSCLGLVRATVGQGDDTASLVREIRDLQLDLSRFASELASLDPDASEGVEPTELKHITLIEDRLTGLEEEVALPKSFVVPGASAASAHMDIARAVCRRLERRLVALADSGEYRNELGLTYINRVGDYLFMLARAIDKRLGAAFDTKGG